MRAHHSAVSTTLEDFSGYPLPSRHAIYHELPARTQKELWAPHLAKYLTVRSLLTAEQVALIREVRDHLNLYLDKTKGEAAQRALPDWAIKVMGFELARDIFPALGPPDATAPSRVPAFTRLRHGPRANSHATLVSAQAYGVVAPAIRVSGIACECSRESDWCRNGYGCVERGVRRGRQLRNTVALRLHRIVSQRRPDVSLGTLRGGRVEAAADMNRMPTPNSRHHTFSPR